MIYKFVIYCQISCQQFTERCLIVRMLVCLKNNAEVFIIQTIWNSQTFYTKNIRWLTLSISRLVTIYWSLNMSLSEDSLLCDLIGRIVDSLDASLIFGDFNIPGINWDTSSSQWCWSTSSYFNISQLRYSSTNQIKAHLSITNWDLIFSSCHPANEYSDTFIYNTSYINNSSTPLHCLHQYQVIKSNFEESIRTIRILLSINK